MLLTEPRHWTPNIKSGYARSASESANPELWKALLGAWIPALDDSIALRNQVNGIRATVGATLPVTAKIRQQGVACIEFAENLTRSLAIPNIWAINPQLTATTVFQRVNYDAMANYEASFMQDGTNNNNISGKNGGIIYAYISGNVDGPGTHSNGVWKSVCTTIKVPPISPSVATCWVDGKSGTPQSRTPTGSTSDFIIGADDANPGWGLDGKVAETYFWNRVLKPKEIILMSHDPLAPFRLRSRVSVVVAAPPAETRQSLTLLGVG